MEITLITPNKTMDKLKYIFIAQFHCFLKSVKSQNQCKSVVQTSYDIIKAHGGEIIIESQGALGAKFEILLPIE